MSLAPLFDPSILFFVVGIAAGLMKSSLEIPVPIARFLSLYLLMALGLKGGFALAQSGFTLEVLADLGIAIGLAVIIPLLCYAILRRVIGGFDAAAISATYGSVSAVTFITATQFLEKQGLEYGGHMAAAMALMESPAIIFAVLMANMLRRRSLSAAGGDPLFGQTYALHPEQVPKSRHGVDEHSSLGAVLKESFTEGAQILLLGSMLIGLLTGDAGKQIMEPFTGQLFKGMLAFFFSIWALRLRVGWLILVVCQNDCCFTACLRHHVTPCSRLACARSLIFQPVMQRFWRCLPRALHILRCRQCSSTQFPRPHRSSTWVCRWV